MGSRSKNAPAIGADTWCRGFLFSLHIWPRRPTFARVTVTAELFKPEIADALKAYERYVVCIDKTPDQFLESMRSLVTKAIHEFENRGPHQRHGIALDRFVTVIVSQTEAPRPLCAIYFNLHSPYLKKASAKSAKQTTGALEEGRPKSDE